MPTESSYLSVDIPDVDLWSFMFESRREEVFQEEQVIYRSLCEGRFYTYAAVKSTAESFGEALFSRLDWRKGDILSIFSANDIDVGPCIYGTLYAGGIVSPANPSYSAEEFAYMLKDAGAKAIVTQEAFLGVVLEAARLSGISAQRIILIGNDEGDSTNQESPHLSQSPSSDTTLLKFQAMCSEGRSCLQKKGRAKINPDVDLAFLVYSSGTTGLPKGVMLSHKNIVFGRPHDYRSVGKYYSHKKDKFLGVLPFYHIYGIEMVYLLVIIHSRQSFQLTLRPFPGLTGLVHQPLYRGIELVVLPSFNLELFCRTIQDHKITFVYVAPPVIVHLARNPLVEKFDLSSLRMITSGAAPLTQELIESVYARLKLKVNQAYGLSETSPMTHTQCATNDCSLAMEEWHSSVGSVGKMFPNMTAKYMSEDGKELGPGEAGELWLKGPNVFKGYWKRPEATKKTMSEDGYFKTGDVGFQDADHNFYITDRVKELIKYKGFQVAPAELEGLLLSNPEINDVAVIGVDLPEEHTETPRAYVVAAPGVARDHATAKRIVQWLGTRVAYYKKLRGGVRFVDEIPKSNSGKILRRILKDQAKSEMRAIAAKL